mmetsp:Transcript_28637/g.58546  ORF Transcript_28637/g.58546 Transcript_28637/m.58546 type:complete len:238 (+) Transcript_28637:617-1330(+)
MPCVVRGGGVGGSREQVRACEPLQRHGEGSSVRLQLLAPLRLQPSRGKGGPPWPRQHQRFPRPRCSALPQVRHLLERASGVPPLHLPLPPRRAPQGGGGAADGIAVLSAVALAARHPYRAVQGGRGRRPRRQQLHLPPTPCAYASTGGRTGRGGAVRGVPVPRRPHARLRPPRRQQAPQHPPLVRAGAVLDGGLRAGDATLRALPLPRPPPHPRPLPRPPRGGLRASPRHRPPRQGP